MKSKPIWLALWVVFIYGALLYSQQPVAQSGAPWTVSQSGTWNIGTVTTLTGITNHVTVDQGTSGSAWPVSQSGTWTVQPGNTANTTPWLVRLRDDAQSITAAISAWGTAPTGTEVEGVNADQFISGTLQNNDGTAGYGGVGGHFADNGVAAASNRIPILPCIYQTGYLNGTAATQGRNGAQSCGSEGLLWTAQLPALRPASFHSSASFAGSSTTIASHLIGHATNMVLVTKITFSCTQTTAGNVTVTVNKTSTASSGGTAGNMTEVPDDSSYSAASGSAESFTGTGPTVGTAVGQVDAYKLGCNATATASPNDIYILNLRQKPITLRSTSQTLEIGVGAATTGGNYTVTWEWMEMPIVTP